MQTPNDTGSSPGITFPSVALASAFSVDVDSEKHNVSRTGKSQLPEKTQKTLG